MRTRWKAQLPGRVVRGTPHRLGYVGFGRYRGRLRERSKNALRERCVRLGNQPCHARPSVDREARGGAVARLDQLCAHVEILEFERE